MAETTSVNPELLLDQVSAIPGDGQPPGRAWLSPSHSVVAGENAIWCPMVDSNHRCGGYTSKWSYAEPHPLRATRHRAVGGSKAVRLHWYANDFWRNNTPGRSQRGGP